MFAYWMLHYRRIWRGTFVISVLNPLLFLSGLGVGLGALVDRMDYVAFLAPGLLAAAMMQTAAVEAMRPVYRAVRGSYLAAAATPLGPGAIQRAHLSFQAFRIVTSGAAFVLVMVLFRVTGPARAAPLLAASLLTGLAFATPITAWAVGLDRPQALEALFRFGIMPMYMFSGTFFETDSLPDVPRWIVEALPLWHGVELCRSLSLGTAAAGPAAIHVTYLCVLAGAGLVAGAHRYRRRLHA
ncbi:ABC transporter permease [Actinocorallia longicatena]|uniref:ABC transporter permease n=1 Tax=Actinocorallia longicatena TaxID=111803 RepID=A0ABP6QKR0_9ACTN